MYDHEAPDGSKVGWAFSYNQGIMLQAASALAEATGNHTYCSAAEPIVQVCGRRRARRWAERGYPRRLRFSPSSLPLLTPFPLCAQFLATNLTSPTGVLFDGDAQHCTGDCALFKGITVRGLVAFSGVCGSSDARRLAETSVASLWTKARNATTTTFSADWDGPPPVNASDNALGNAISATAALGSVNYSEPSARNAASAHSLLQAEEGLLRALGVAAAEGNFSGWGYVAGWEASHQSVRFPVPEGGRCGKTAARGRARGALLSAPSPHGHARPLLLQFLSSVPAEMQRRAVLPFGTRQLPMQHGSWRRTT